MLFNLPPKEQYSRVGLPFLMRFTGGKMKPDDSFHANTVAKLVKDAEWVPLSR